MDFLTQREQLHLYTSFKISEEVKLKATFLQWQEPLYESIKCDLIDPHQLLLKFR